MKRIVMLAVASLVVCSGVVRAQVKVDVDDYKQKIAKSDADIANPKKNVKPATWLDRGKLFLDIAQAPTKGTYVTQVEKEADILLGKPVSPATNQTVGTTAYRVVEYPTLTAYMTKNPEGVYAMQLWMSKVNVTDNPLGKAMDANQKAYAIDSGATTAKAVKTAQETIANEYKQLGANYMGLLQYPQAAEAFANAYDALEVQPANYPDTVTAFNAGLLFTMGQQFDRGAKYLEKALQFGYDADGDIYYYLYHCYYGQKQMASAKEILLKGLDKYPKNTKIVEGLLAIYTTSGEGDPQEIVAIVQKAIERDPENPALYSGLGLIYDKLGEVDNAIQAFGKAAEMVPDDFNANFNLGLLYVKKGDRQNTEFAKQVFTSKDELDKEISKVNAVYALALPALEKSLALKPGTPEAIELLKNLTFRLQEEPGMREKYEKYKAMFDALPAAAE